MPVAIRTCESIDLPFVLRCMMALAEECPDRPPMDLVQAQATFELFREKPDLGRLVVIEREGGIVGYALVSLCWSRDVYGVVVTIEELYVTPANRRRGVASGFMRWLQAQWAGRAKALRLNVEPGEEQFRGICRRLGFVATPVVRLERELPPSTLSLPPRSRPGVSRPAQC